MLSKKHFVQLARMLSTLRTDSMEHTGEYGDGMRYALKCVEYALVSMCAEDNPRFDVECFQSAAQPPKEY